ncbi:MAG: hypothetical protein EXQ94_07230 [Alphaproteobacteria bacterium]|nr:hypothetical protein [Alphaproteobacteria bacterium]
MRAAPALLAALCLLAIAGCETFTGADKPVTCPIVYVVGEAGKITQYREGSGTDLTEVRFAAAIADFNWACEYDDDGSIDIEIAIDFSAFRGPAAADDVGRFPYFVVIADPDREILAKQEFTLVVEFAGNSTTQIQRRIAGATFYVHDPDNGAAHQLYIGFQLDEAQLENNRKAL